MGLVEASLDEIIFPWFDIEVSSPGVSRIET